MACDRQCSIRDEDDFNRHIDYIHYNSVKHGLARNPFEWRFSSASEYLREGFYPDDWGIREALEFDGEYGE